MRLINKLEKVYELCADLCIGGRYMNECLLFIEMQDKCLRSMNKMFHHMYTALYIREVMNGERDD